MALAKTEDPFRDRNISRQHSDRMIISGALGEWKRADWKGEYAAGRCARNDLLTYRVGPVVRDDASRIGPSIR